MHGLRNLIQWLSTAFVVWMAISWWAVGSPITTTRFLFAVHDLMVASAEKVSEQDFGVRSEIQEERLKQEQAANGYEGYYQEETWPLGKGPSKHHGHR